MQFITIDFETYWDTEYTLSKLSTSAYVYDPRFEVVGVAVKINNQKPVWMEEYQFRAFAASVDWTQVGILSHHTHFDGLILSHYYAVRPMFWFCTLSMSRAISGPHAGHSLEVLAKRYKAGEKGTEILNTRGLRRKDFTPEGYARYGEYSCNDDNLEFDIFQKMMKETNYPQSELQLIDATIRMFTEPTLVLDEDVMWEYLVYEIQKKQELLERVGVQRKDLLSNDKFADLLRLLGEEPPTKAGKPKPDGSPKTIYAFAKTDPGFKDLLEHKDDNIRWLSEARLGIKSTGNETRTGRMLLLGAGGKPMPVYLNYCGAHTQRWSGGDKVNMQNFERVDNDDPRKGTIRRAICAPKGYKIVVADSGQIEARFLAWFACHYDLIRRFASGADVYSWFASKIFGRKIDRKNNPGDKIPGHLGKCQVLGLGFGMGDIKLAAELQKGMLGGPAIQFTEKDIEVMKINPAPFLANPRNIERVQEMPSRLPIKERLIHCLVSNYIVNNYREENKPIVQMHEFHKEVLGWMVEGKKTSFDYLGILRLADQKIYGPNGLALVYPGIEYGKWKDKKTGEEKKGYQYFNGRHMTGIHGALLTENLVQWLCRIIIGEQILKIRKKYRVVTMSHDEPIMVVPNEQADECLADTLEIMTATPDWAPGLPLAAEGGIGDTYAEAKS